jgi:AcrR family transcriptional regulator
MGRPREHDAATAAALVDTAGRIVEAEGLDALSVRRVADEAGTTTRAVYSLFGSKNGLVVALGRRAFELLGTGIDELPTTQDPAADLVEAGVVVFRCFVLEHPSLFTIGVQRTQTAPGLAEEFRATATDALAGLTARMRRLEASDLLDGRRVADAVFAFHALCEGLAAVELRGLMPPGCEEQIWREALAALVAGFALPSDAAARRADPAPAPHL